MQDLTTGSISKHLLTTASFMLVTMVFQTLYFLVDLFCVGYLGKEAVAGVGVAGNLTFVVLAVTQMLAVGTTTLVSHAVGQEDEPRALLVFNQSQVLSTVVGRAVPRRVDGDPHGLHAEPRADAATAQAAGDYLLYYLPAMALQFPMAGMAAALRGVGNFKPGMIVQTSTIIINIVLAPAADLRTLRPAAAGVGGRRARDAPRRDRRHGVALDLLLRPRGLSALSTARTCRRSSAVGRDAQDRAARRRRVPDDGRLPDARLGAGTPVRREAQAGFVIGMRVGAGALHAGRRARLLGGAGGRARTSARGLGDRVKTVFKDASLMAVGWMLLMAVLCNLVPAALIGIFSSDPAVLAIGEEYLRIVAFTFAFSGLIFVCSSMFQAMGNTMPSLIASVTRIIVIAVPAIALSTTPGFKLVWIWYLSAGAVVLQLAIVLLLLRREFRTRLGRLSMAPVAGAMASPEAL
jgi:Na+-driven multidrug efflux pump